MKLIIKENYSKFKEIYLFDLFVDEIGDLYVKTSNEDKQNCLLLHSTLEEREPGTKCSFIKEGSVKRIVEMHITTE